MVGQALPYKMEKLIKAMALRNIVILVVVVSAVAWYASHRSQHDTAQVPQYIESKVTLSPIPQQFKCEGKTRCSQMSSCEEAKFYLRNCPGTEIDGDRDGIPCEMQWCQQ